MKILITGIAGSGKSTIIAELQRRGRKVIDLDDCGVCVWVNKKTGIQAEYHEGAGKEWIENHRWQVVVPRLIGLLNSFGNDKDIFVGGKVARIQLGEIKEIFDRIYLLIPDDAIIHERLRTRTINKVNFAKGDDERKTIIEGRRPFEAACLEIGAIPLNNRGTVSELIKDILNSSDRAG